MMRKILQICFLISISALCVNCQESSCDTLSVSGVGNSDFDGTYRPYNYSVSWMANEDVYKKVNGSKYLFPLNSSNSTDSSQWGLGSATSLITGQHFFNGILENNATWTGRGIYNGTTILITDTSCRSNEIEEFSPPSMSVTIDGSTVQYEGDEDYGEVSYTLYAGNRCFGKLAVYYGPVGNPLSNFRMIYIRPGAYRRTSRMFRRKQIVKVQVFGNCRWNFYTRSNFGGQHITRGFGNSQPLTFRPNSIKNES